MGGANNITLGSGATAPVSGQLGFVVSATLSATVSVPATTWTVALSLSLNPGVYVVTGNLGISLAISSTAHAAISTNSTGGPASTEPRVNAYTGATALFITTTRIMKFTATTSVYLYCYSSGTSTVSLTGTSFDAVRIA
jgi:hypothetical protein